MPSSPKILLLAALIVVACRSEHADYPAMPADARADSIILVTGPFEIGGAVYTADYATVAVPENRNATAPRTIAIPFLRVHASSPSPSEPIFFFSGGPGQSNMTRDWGRASMFLPQHDVVLVGYRGVDGPVTLDCPEVTAAFKNADDPLSQESMQSLGKAWTAGAARLQAQGIELDGYTIPETIEDNEAVRRYLGYNRIDLLGESYGTRVAYLYGLKHPENVCRTVLVSVNPPGHFVWNPAITDDQLTQYSRLWSNDSVARTKSPDLYAAMKSVLGAMPRRWLVFPINPGKVKVVTFALLFHRKTAAMVFDAFIAAYHGDPSGLALMSLAYDYVIPSLMVWGDLASKAVSADRDAYLSPHVDEDSSRAPLGAPMSKLLWGSLRYTDWPTTMLPEEFRKLRPSSVQTLLLSGSMDFSTPPQFATNELLPYLKNGRQVVLSECGHVNDVWYVRPENTQLLLTSFYDTGIPDESLNAYVPMDFSVGWGFPTIAKVTLGTITFLAIALMTALGWIVRKYRQRHTARVNAQEEGW